MSLHRLFSLAALLAIFASSTVLAASPDDGKGQAALAAASQANKFCFLLFYKANDPATQSAAKTLSEGIAKRTDRASFMYVNVTDPKEQAIVKEFDVARAAMPFMLAVAPNGAVTGVYPKPFTDAELDKAFVTPGMTQVMKQMQNGKMVFICIRPGAVTQLPAGVSQFTADPQFMLRSAVVPLRNDDPNEARFIQELDIKPAHAFDTTVVFLAPPGAMVGKYAGNVTKAQLAADLHKAGKCCDDPNCKHGKK